MKILYDYAAFLTQNRGGVTRVMNEVIKRELAREDVECKVFAGFHKNLEIHEMNRQFPGKIHEILLPKFLAKQRLFMPVNQALFAPFAKHFAPDICHYTLFKTPPVPAKTKTVITVHDLIGEIRGQRDVNPQVKEREVAMKKVHGIVCISERTKADLLKFYDVQDIPILVAHHGNSLRDCAPTAPPIEKPYFLFVSSRDGYKNFSLVLDAFVRHEILKPYSLVCFGGRAFSNEEKAALKKLNLADRVLYREGTDSELAGYYKHATALIYPSKYEGFGLPPIEAMGFECPVLASSAPPMPEVIGDAALFFDPESQEELLSAIQKLLGETGVRESLIEKGKQRERSFSWERTFLKIHDFYCSLLS